MKKIQSPLLETGVHLITALVLAIKGSDKLFQGHHISGAIILSFGILVFLITLFQKRLKLSHPKAKCLINFIEGIALLIVAYLYFKEGKVYLPYFYLIPSILFFISAAIAMRKESTSKQWIRN